jgi:hypothetical protein
MSHIRVSKLWRAPFFDPWWGGILFLSWSAGFEPGSNRGWMKALACSVAPFAVQIKGFVSFPGLPPARLTALGPEEGAAAVLLTDRATGRAIGRAIGRAADRPKIGRTPWSKAQAGLLVGKPGQAVSPALIWPQSRYTYPFRQKYT